MDSALPAVVAAAAVAALIIVVVFSSMRVVRDGRALAIIRLGRFSHLAGPGLVILVPLLDRALPVAVGQPGVLADGERADLGGHLVPVVISFPMARPGLSVKVQRIEGSGPTLRVVVARAG